MPGHCRHALCCWSVNSCFLAQAPNLVVHEYPDRFCAHIREAGVVTSRHASVSGFLCVLGPSAPVRPMCSPPPFSLYLNRLPPSTPPLRRRAAGAQQEGHPQVHPGPGPAGGEREERPGGGGPGRGAVRGGEGEAEQRGAALERGVGMAGGSGAACCCGGERPGGGAWTDRRVSRWRRAAAGRRRSSACVREER